MQYLIIAIIILVNHLIGEAVPEEEFVKISLRDISTANFAAEEMGGASGAATPPMSRQSSYSSSVSNSDTPVHSSTTLPSLHTTTPPGNSNHVAIENYCNGEIPSSAASPIHELKTKSNTIISNLPSVSKSEDYLLLEREREKLCAALDEKV